MFRLKDGLHTLLLTGTNDGNAAALIGGVTLHCSDEWLMLNYDSFGLLFSILFGMFLCGNSEETIDSNDEALQKLECRPQPLLYLLAIILEALRCFCLSSGEARVHPDRSEGCAMVYNVHQLIWFISSNGVNQLGRMYGV